MEKHNIIARASGHDLALLWLNMGKILVLLAFIYQGTLRDQLGINMFENAYYVIRPTSVSADSSGPGAGGVPESGPAAAPVQHITDTAPEFEFVLLPLSISRRYDRVTVDVTGVWKMTANPEGGERWEAQAVDGGATVRRSFSWPERSLPGVTPLQRAEFSLADLRPSPVPGAYAVAFDVSFWVDGKSGPVFTESYPVASGPRRDGDHRHKNLVWLEYSQASERRFGPFPVVQCQWFEETPDLRDRPYTLVAPVLEVRNQRFYPTRGLQPERAYEQRGYFEEEGRRIDFSVEFALLRNQPPRSTYLGPGEEDMYFVKLFSDYLYDAPDLSFTYFNLSQFLIDPDGRNERGRPDVRVPSVALQSQPGNDFELIRAGDGSGDFWLKLNRGITDIIRTRGGELEIGVTASDGCASQPIRLRIVRTT